MHTLIIYNYASAFFLFIFPASKQKPLLLASLTVKSGHCHVTMKLHSG